MRPALGHRRNSDLQGLRRSSIVASRHHINPKAEEQRRDGKSVSNTGVHTGARFFVTRSALGVIVEAVDDKDCLSWDSFCSEYAL